VSQRLRHLKPSGERRGYPIYRIDEASRYLVNPIIDIEAYIRQTDPKLISPYVLKEFWAGQLGKQRFEDNEAHLWPASDVKEMFTDIFEKP
jgi:hypothetical protein